MNFEVLIIIALSRLHKQKRTLLIDTVLSLLFKDHLQKIECWVHI